MAFWCYKYYDSPKSIEDLIEQEEYIREQFEKKIKLDHIEHSFKLLKIELMRIDERVLKIDEIFKQHEAK
jgi:hypothetical protein